jgi:signal transduction histidine kinase
MSYGTEAGSGTRGRRPRRWSWIVAGAVSCARGLVLGGLVLGGAVLLLWLAGTAVFAAAGYGLYRVLGGKRLGIAAAVLVPVVVLVLALIHKGALSIAVVLILGLLVVGMPLAPPSLLAVRRLAASTRRLSGRWCGVPIADPYRHPASGEWVGYRERLRWLTDPASWRDLLWLAVNSAVGWILACAPAALAAYGGLCLLGAEEGGRQHPVVLVLSFRGLGYGRPTLLALGVACVGLALWAAPWLLRAYGLLARSLLAPTGPMELALRVAHLTQTRADTIDTGAAELRRIERDLHDGAQARLVAMGMTLDAADQMLDDNPAAVRALLAEARESSAKALAELRALVRGIHPPVLADRGLAEAVRALTLDLPLRVHYTADLAARPPAPVESAAYFAVSELLANVTKHARARQAWVDLRHDGVMLRIGVSDDGTGGADPARGSGLAGIERRLAAFDGVLALSSPPGGPTVVNLEIPCALSSPKTSSS